MKKAGNINAVRFATVYAGKKRIAKVMDATNPMAVAFRELPKATHIVVSYPGFKDETIRRNEIDLSCQGLKMTTAQAMIEVL